MSEEKRVVKIGVIKNGNLGMSLVLDLIMDERADRNDLDVVVAGSGAKLNKEQALFTAKQMLEWKPELILMVSPNAALKGLQAAREVIQPSGIPTIVFSDAPAKKGIEDFEAKGMGYFINQADAMISARRPFLDSVEMSLYNANLLKVITITGVVNLMTDLLEKCIDDIKAGQKPELPRLNVTKEKAVAAARFSNPYAQAKALAAFEIASRVSSLTGPACFVIKEREKYMPLLAAAHEMMQVAAKLAEEAREIEKANDKVIRRPHHREGKLLQKLGLMDKEA
ncbi:MAG: F420-dependent methylenetetrahydromethanopterin dehydrogenase [Promethearchaeota archaeon]